MPELRKLWPDLVLADWWRRRRPARGLRRRVQQLGLAKRLVAAWPHCRRRAGRSTTGSPSLFRPAERRGGLRHRPFRALGLRQAVLARNQRWLSGSPR